MNYEKQRITTYLPQEMVDQIDEISMTTGLTRNALITIAVKTLINQKQVVIDTEVKTDRTQLKRLA